jgi:hypothetical protein
MKALAALLAALILTGCASSRWETEYVGVKAPGSGARAEPVEVRSVPWERVDATLKELDAEIAGSDVPAAYWSEERKADAHTKLMRGLQVKADPRTVVVLGRSEFATYDPMMPGSAGGRAELESFARKIGADAVVWSSHSLGITERLVDRPIYGGRGELYGIDPAVRATYSDSETMWVPTRVSSERTAYLAFFLRFLPER